eukprot:TRINITY_DN4996_c0_g3_i1.p1 TRINITY_DN4996_c0_g3~~TRINITY_DN4996_c0_g3_i1.p1  ORF type:complete len:271 (+),score=101.62 TRINITY_DN4996_c0_g3_i1:72-884(+)
MAPTDKEIKGAIDSVIDMEGFALTVTTLRKVVCHELGTKFEGDGEKLKFRKLVEECLKGQLLRQPSLVETLKDPVVNKGVGKKKGGRKSTGSKVSGSKRKSTGESSEAKKPKKERKTSAKKETVGPKKPLTAYFIFAKQNRERLQKENVGKSVGEIAKITGELWRGLKEDDPVKKEAVDAAAKDKERYAKEYADWLLTDEGKAHAEKKKPKRTSTSSKPKARKPKHQQEEGLAGVVDEDATSTEVESESSDSSDSSSSSGSSSSSSSSSS